MNIYTLGYEKRDIEEFIMILTRAKVDKLIDIREVAWSYKRDFCKTKFSNSLADAGIKYIHIKELGNPKSIRKSGVGTSEILDNYRLYLEETKSGIPTLLQLIEITDRQNKNICLTCFERDYSECHRSVIINLIKNSVSTLNVVHL